MRLLGLSGIVLQTKLVIVMDSSWQIALSNELMHEECNFRTIIEEYGRGDMIIGRFIRHPASFMNLLSMNF